MVSVMGYMSLFVAIGLPIAVIFLVVFVYQMKRNGDIQVEQNKKIIELLEKVKPGELIDKQ